MEVLALCAAGLAAALCALVVRQRTPEIAAVLALTACALLLGQVLPLFQTVRDTMTQLARLAGVSETIFRPVLQVVGLSIVTNLSAACCRDAGASAIADFLNLAGGVAAVVVSLPLLRMVLQLILDLL